MNSDSLGGSGVNPEQLPQKYTSYDHKLHFFVGCVPESAGRSALQKSGTWFRWISACRGLWVCRWVNSAYCTPYFGHLCHSSSSGCGDWQSWK